MDKVALFEFDDVDAPVAFIGCKDLIELLPSVFSRWPHRPVAPENDAAEPFLTMERTEEGYRISSPFMQKPSLQPDPLNALCSLVVELAWASLRAHPNRLCVHGAAIEFAGRLVLIPSGRRAGKSTLTACLAAMEYPVFTDDFLSIELGKNGHPLGLASGVAPRIRNPLPSDFSAAMKAYVAGSGKPTNRQYSYLQIGEAALAPRGAGLSIGAIVVLRREPGAKASLRPADMADVLKAIIVQNFSRAQNAGRILQVLHFLASTVELRVLRYSRAEDAAKLLSEEFATWPSKRPAQGLQHEPEISSADATGDLPPRPAFDPDTRYVQSSAMVEYVVENARFLADSDGFAIHQLNEMSSAIWNVLAQPSTLQEISHLFCDAFPDQPRGQIEADVKQLLKHFVQNRLVIPAQPQDHQAAGE